MEFETVEKFLEHESFCANCRVRTACQESSINPFACRHKKDGWGEAIMLDNLLDQMRDEKNKKWIFALEKRMKIKKYRV